MVTIGGHQQVVSTGGINRWHQQAVVWSPKSGSKIGHQHVASTGDINRRSCGVQKVAARVAISVTICGHQQVASTRGINRRSRGVQKVAARVAINNGHNRWPSTVVTIGGHQQAPLTPDSKIGLCIGGRRVACACSKHGVAELLVGCAAWFCRLVEVMRSGTGVVALGSRLHSRWKRSK